MKHSLLAVFAFIVLGLAACSDSGKSTGAASAGSGAASGANQSAADPEITSIYNRSCRSCHSVAGTGAPQTGDVAAWEPRMAKGMDAMVTSVVEGFGGMPPFGFCMDCDVEQFEALITYMAQGK